MQLIDIFWQNSEITTLAPIWKPDLEILFVGLNPSLPSIESGHYHQGNLGKKFWRRLRSIGLMEDAEVGAEDQSMLENGLGITDLVPRPTARADQITEEELSLGSQFVVHQIRQSRPRIVCFIYKKALEAIIGGKVPGDGGLIESQDDAWKGVFGESRVFLLPSPYAAAETEKEILQSFKDVITKVRAEGI